MGHAGAVSCVAYSRNGERIVSGGFDKTIKVWDAVSGKELLSIKGHTGGVLSVALSPDGNRIVSGGTDGNVKVWYTSSSMDAREKR
jgi:WD40 repeat protein